MSKPTERDYEVAKSISELPDDGDKLLTSHGIEIVSELIAAHVAREITRWHGARCHKDTKVKYGLGGKDCCEHFLYVESGLVGTLSYQGESIADCIHQLIDDVYSGAQAEHALGGE